MQAKQEKLLDLLGRPDARYVIPVYQRAYAWGPDQCDALWHDVLAAGSAGSTHFVSTVLLAGPSGDAANEPAACEPSGALGGNPGELMVVDGQQRLVSVTLMLVALRDRLARGDVALPFVDADVIQETYLSPAGTRKLVLSRADDVTLESVVSDSALPQHPSARVQENLASFREKMDAEDFDAETFWRGLRGLYVIAVDLDGDDAPQAIFESFNSKGVPLVTADLCRNYLLLPLPHADQVRIYDEYWEPMMDLFGDDPGSLRFNNAILGWLTVRFRRIRAKGDKQAFAVFKRYCEEERKGSLEDMLREMRNFCMVWAENYRYHAVKKYKTADWAVLGAKTLVSDYERKAPDNPEAYRFYVEHFNVAAHW